MKQRNNAREGFGGELHIKINGRRGVGGALLRGNQVKLLIRQLDQARRQRKRPVHLRGELSGVAAALIPDVVFEFGPGVLQHGADLGIANDGDADRCLVIDEKGNELDGDQIMLICALQMKRENRLRENTIVGTVMSNIGFHKAAEELGMKTVSTAVGDRYVVEEMRKSGYNLGGEQSGHVILMDYNTTGDGQLTAVQLTKVIRETGKTLSQLASEVTIYPQKLVNIRVENAMKEKAMEVPAIKTIIEKMEEEMAGNGRILVRPSGTEPLLRVMAEAPTAEEVNYYVDTIAAVVKDEIGID